MKIIILIALSLVSFSAFADEQQCAKAIAKYEGNDKGVRSSIDVLQSKDEAKDRVYNSQLRDYEKTELYHLIDRNHFILLVQDVDAGIYGSANLILMRRKNCSVVKSVQLWSD